MAFGGIDFGTSNSTVAVMEGDAPHLLPLEGQNVTLPSAVFFNFEDDQTLFGRQAISSYTEGVEGRLLRSLKSVLGSSLVHEKTRVKARSLPFSEIIGLFIGRLKVKLDGHMGQSVSQVVLGRPVHFVDGDEVADRQAQDELEKAAKAQGFRHVEFQFEPIAAALDYERQASREELALIVDVGGGTSDFSLVRISPDWKRKADRRDDILASAGVHIGGTDFDRLLSITYVMPNLGYLTPTKDGKRNLPAAYFIDLATWHRIHRLYAPKALTDLRQIRYEAARPELVDRFIDIVEHRLGHLLATRVEQAKIDLTQADLAEVKLDLSQEALDISFTRRELENTLEQGVIRIVDTVRETLRLAAASADAVTAVFLTGGSTAIPLVRDSILSLVPDAKVVKGDVFGSVGLGLALDAARKFG